MSTSEAPPSPELPSPHQRPRSHLPSRPGEQLLWELGARQPGSSPQPPPDPPHTPDMLDKNLGLTAGELRTPKGINVLLPASTVSLSLPRPAASPQEEPATYLPPPPSQIAPSPPHSLPHTSASSPEPTGTLTQPPPSPLPQTSVSQRMEQVASQSSAGGLSPDPSLEFLKLPDAGTPGKTSHAHPAGRGAGGEGETSHTHPASRGGANGSMAGLEPGSHGFEDSGTERRQPLEDEAARSAVVDQYTAVATPPLPTVLASSSAATTPPHVNTSFLSRPLPPATRPLPPASSPLTPRQGADPRTALLEKHSKHVADLKQYYDSEVAELQRQLQELQLQPRPLRPPGLSSPVAPEQPRPLRPPEPSSPVAPLGSGAGSSELQLENGRLRAECSELQRRLESTTRGKYVLDEQTQRLQQAVAEWKQRYLSSERMVAVLQDRLSVTRTNLEQQDKMVGQLQDDLQAATEELQLWREQQTQGLEKFDQLLSEFEILQKENRTLQLSCSSLEEELFVCRQEQATLRTTAETSIAREEQLKSIIARLESEVRHLRHVNNRLHSQGTHYELGAYQSPLPVNRPDEDKLHHSFSSTPPRTPPRTGIDRKLRGSPFRGSTPAPTPSPAQHPTAPSLTRRKWLEPSDPGLITGAAHILAPNTTRTPSHHTATSTPSRHTATSTPSHHTGPSHPSTPSHHTGPSHPSTPSHRTGPSHPSTPSHRTGPSHPSTPSHRTGTSHPSTPSHHTDTASDVRVEDLETSPIMAATRESLPRERGERDVGSVAESLLQAVRSGRITGEGEEGRGGATLARGGSGMTVEERVQRHMRTVATAEQRLSDLQAEKDQLESALQRTPRAGGRVTHQAKQKQLAMEGRLEVVLREIGSTRMVLRSHHALRK